MNDSQSLLPSGWVWTYVNEISSLIRGVSYNKSEAFKASKDGFLPILRATNINKQLNFDDLVYVPIPCISSEQMIRKFDVIFAMSSGSKDLVGKSAQAISDFHGGFGTFCGLIRPMKGLNEQYFGFFFQSPEYRKKISTLSSGIGINNLRRDDIESIVFPLPPLPEQLRIVTKIEELLTQLDAGVASLKKAQAQLKRYRQAVLKAAFEGRLTQEWREEHKGKIEPVEKLITKPPLEKNDLASSQLADGWVWTSVVDIGEVIGGLTKNQKRSQYPIKMPYLRVANVYSNRLDLTDVAKIGVLESELKRLLLKKGDLLIVEGNGSADQIGRVALWNDQISPCIHQNHLIKIRPSASVSGKFLLYWLLSTAGRQEITNVASSTSGLYTLNISKVENLSFPLAPISEQNIIINEIERLFSIADEIEQTITTSLRQAESLRQSILKRAFEGKLVPQDPTDEPASVLLERIKSEKAHNAETKKGKTLQPKSPKRKIKNGN